MNKHASSLKHRPRGVTNRLAKSGGWILSSRSLMKGFNLGNFISSGEKQLPEQQPSQPGEENEMQPEPEIIRNDYRGSLRKWRPLKYFWHQKMPRIYRDRLFMQTAANR